MQPAPFHPDLADLLDDPLTRRVMASDRIDMATMLALLDRARCHLLEARRRGSARSGA